MTLTVPAFQVRRVFVALEPDCENLAAIERAALLAERAHAELHAIFLEDERLLDAAALPFTHYVCLSSGACNALEPATIQREYRALAERARRRLEELGRRLNLASSFEIVRGDRIAALAKVGCDDLLVMETRARTYDRNKYVLTDRFAAATCGYACLLLGPVADARRNVLVLYDGSAIADRALAAARALHGNEPARLILLRAFGAPPESELRQRFRGSNPPVDIRDMAAINAAELRRAVAHAACGLVVVPAPLIAAHQAELGDLLPAPPCALLLVT